MCVRIAAFLQLFHTLRCARTQIVEPAKHNRFGRTNLCTRGNESALLAVVTKRAFECATSIGKRLRPAIDHAKWTGDDAVTAAVADIVLDEDRANFSTHDCAGWTRLEATRVFAMLANIGEKYPAKGIFTITISQRM